MRPTLQHSVFIALAALLLPCPLKAQENDVADIPSQNLRAGKDENMHYFLMGPRTGVETPEEGYGLLIAMSVFKPSELPSLDKAKDHAYYIYHSPQDRMAPMRMAQQAAKVLEENGAKVKFATYEGGHGWRGPVFDDIRAGIEWLEQ